MLRRRLLLMVIGIAGFAVLGAGLIACLTSPGDRISRASYNEIKAGMSEQEVQVLLGGPAGDYTGGRYCIPMLMGGCRLCTDELYGNLADVRLRLEWTGSKGAVWIGLDEHGKVMQKFHFPVVPVDRSGETLLAKLRRWLGL